MPQRFKRLDRLRTGLKTMIPMSSAVHLDSYHFGCRPQFERAAGKRLGEDAARHVLCDLSRFSNAFM